MLVLVLVHLKLVHFGEMCSLFVELYSSCYHYEICWVPYSHGLTSIFCIFSGHQSNAQSQLFATAGCSPTSYKDAWIFDMANPAKHR